MSFKTAIWKQNADKWRSERFVYERVHLPLHKGTDAASHIWKVDITMDGLTRAVGGIVLSMMYEVALS